MLLAFTHFIQNPSQNYNSSRQQFHKQHSPNIMSDEHMSRDTKPSLWQSVVQSMIRPPRLQYQLSELGARLVNFKGTVYNHKEHYIRHLDTSLELTCYEPVDCLCKLVVLYLHGNSSSRLEALTLLPGLPSTYALAAFDFLGCGLDPEKYITLGVREAQQIRTVVGFLEDKDYKVILWGRSMGASSALKFGGTWITIADSPFSSIRRVCKETALDKSPSYIPKCLVSCLFPCVFYKLNRDVKKAAQFDLNDLDIEKDVRKMDPSKAIIFLVASEDSLIKGSHSQRLFDAFRGQQKRIITFAGNHNSKRSQQTLLETFSELERIIANVEKEKMETKLESSPATEHVIVSLHSHNT